MKELRLVAYNRHEAGANEVVSIISRMCGIRNPFFFNGKPFLGAKMVEVEENDVRVLFSFQKHSEGMNKVFLDCESETKAWISADEITGWEMVEAYDGKRHVGSYINVVTK